MPACHTRRDTKGMKPALLASLVQGLLLPIIGALVSNPINAESLQLLDFAIFSCMAAEFNASTLQGAAQRCRAQQNLPLRTYQHTTR